MIESSDSSKVGLTLLVISVTCLRDAALEYLDKCIIQADAGYVQATRTAQDSLLDRIGL